LRLVDRNPIKRFLTFLDSLRFSH